MITYSLNWMGPISLDWYRKRGLVRDKQITTHYYGGRIDIRDDSREGYDGWDEYAVAPMYSEDWYAFYKFLDRLEHETLISYDSLIQSFEEHSSKPIRWADDNWCPECYMTLPDHKMDCSHNNIG